jgi:hypothetical protein
MGTIAVGLAFAAVLYPILHRLVASFLGGLTEPGQREGTGALGVHCGPGLLALVLVALPRRTGPTGVAGTPARAGAAAHG